MWSEIQMFFAEPLFFNLGEYLRLQVSLLVGFTFITWMFTYMKYIGKVADLESEVKDLRQHRAKDQVDIEGLEYEVNALMDALRELSDEHLRMAREANESLPYDNQFTYVWDPIGMTYRKV